MPGRHLPVMSWHTHSGQMRRVTVGPSTSISAAFERSSPEPGSASRPSSLFGTWATSWRPNPSATDDLLEGRWLSQSLATPHGNERKSNERNIAVRDGASVTGETGTSHAL